MVLALQLLVHKAALFEVIGKGPHPENNPLRLHQQLHIAYPSHKDSKPYKEPPQKKKKKKKLLKISVLIHEKRKVFI